MSDKIKKPRMRREAEGVYSLTYDKRYNLCMAFVRIQEFYESPFFAGKRFSLEEFKEYWSQEFGNGEFDYPERWCGFNIPGKTLADWYNLHLDSFREEEKIIIDKVWSRFYKDGIDLLNSYLIGVSRESTNKRDIINHEMAHALYAKNSDYKKECDKILKNIKKDAYGKYSVERMEKTLLDMGYGKNVLCDEIQAYWSTGSDYLPCELVDKKVWSQILDLKKNFKDSIIKVS
jgi:hypothetical protein